MKTLIMLVASTMLSFSSGAMNGDHPEKYCAKMKDGKKVVMHQGTVITSEAVLSNGTRIQPDGTVTKPDGMKTMLNTGECMDKDGMINVEKEKEKKK